MDITRSRSATAAHVRSLSPALKASQQGGSVAFQIERTAPHCSAVLEYEGSAWLNRLQFDCSVHVLADVAWSDDGVHFYRVHGLQHESRGDTRDFRFPLTVAKYLQVHFYQEGGPVHASELRNFQTSFHSQIKLKASSEYDRLWTAANLTDRREDYGWASLVRDKNEPEEIQADLGELFFIDGVRLKAINDELNYFPPAFQIQLSEDGNVWQTLHSEDHFFSAPATWNSWSFNPTRARFVKIHINKSAHYKKGEYQSKILDVAVSAVAARWPAAEPAASSFIRMASENVPGAVLLAGNTVSAPNRVVQSDDSRLKNASTEYRGIMQFARDNEVAQEKAVQANDSRLKTATMLAPGIVQLAKNGEVRAGAAVQSDDARLNRSSTEAPGIVQLANDRETRSGVAVQGGDSRLKPASADSAGIVTLAQDGELAAGKAVQANDSRLRLATQAWPGIVLLAQAGEIASAKAVAADDPRLIEADESHKGRVQLARHGEIIEKRAVQANDPRLAPATEENRGTVQFSRNGVAVPGQAVQATDGRLSDARNPLPHTHTEYAAAVHDFSQHTGQLHVKRSGKTSLPDGFNAVADINIPLVIENPEGAAASFRGASVHAAEGTASYHVSQTGSALQATSRDQAAATLVSANAYALRLPRSAMGVKSSDKAIHAEGHVLVEGSVSVQGSPCVVVSLPRASNEAFVEGDLLTIENGVAAKLRQDAQVCVGVFTRAGGLSLEMPNAAVRAAVSGVVSLRVFGQVKAGDRLVLNSGQPGTCRVSQGQERLIAVALESVQQDREKPVLSILVR